MVFEKNSRGKLEECRVCGEQVAKNAKLCPHCGADCPGMSGGMLIAEKTATGFGNVVFGLIKIAFFVAILLILLTMCRHVAAADYAWPVVRVVDGDTVEADVLSGGGSARFRSRLAGRRSLNPFSHSRFRARDFHD